MTVPSSDAGSQITLMEDVDDVDVYCVQNTKEVVHG